MKHERAVEAACDAIMHDCGIEKSDMIGALIAFLENVEMGNVAATNVCRALAEDLKP